MLASNAIHYLVHPRGGSIDSTLKDERSGMTVPVAHRLARLVLLCGAAHVPALAAPAEPPAQLAPLRQAAITICEDENEWPPYSYFKRVDGKPTEQVVGYGIDVIGEILGKHGIAFKVEMIPWSRCLAVAALGKDYQLVLNLSFNEERGRAFLFSRSYYSTTPYYFYSKRRHPNGVPIKTAADFKNVRVCGIHGYNYAGYGFAPKEVDQGAKDFTSLIAKLHLGRCGVFLEKVEIMEGYAAIGKDYLSDPDIGMSVAPGIAPGLFHFGVGRQYPHANVLRDLIDNELQTMIDSGRLRELWRKAVAKPPKAVGGVNAGK